MQLSYQSVLLTFRYHSNNYYQKYILKSFLFIVDTDHCKQKIQMKYTVPRTRYFLFLFDIHVRVVDTNQSNLSFSRLLRLFSIMLDM